MIIPILVTLYLILGTIAGRVLYRTRLGNSLRYAMSSKKSYHEKERVIETIDHSSAMTYGLWSIPLWPLTLAIWIVLAPTPQEKRARRTEELQNATQALEKVAREYDLKITV